MRRLSSTRHCAEKNQRSHKTITKTTTLPIKFYDRIIIILMVLMCGEQSSDGRNANEKTCKRTYIMD